jgi:CBS domain-containing protein
MTRPVMTVREDTPFADALTVSAEKHVKRFPVVDAEGRLSSASSVAWSSYAAS